MRPCSDGRTERRNAERLVLTLLLALTLNSAQAGPLDGCPEYTQYGVPSQKGDLLCRKGYALAHNPDKKVPDWVIEHLTKVRAEGTLSRTDNFRADPELAPGKRSELADYAGSGFDRGHMAPAGDRQWDAEAMSQSFLLSNRAPQVGIGFNRGIWAVLEGKVRTRAIRRGAVTIITGPIYSHDTHPPTIGADQVAVPSYFYKINYGPVKVEAIAFIIPNQALPHYDLADYLVSVRVVEQQTGLNFLSRLRTPTEQRVEGRRAKGLW